MMPARSYLFVPGNRAERFAKALASGADRVILDLEDAVESEHWCTEGKRRFPDDPTILQVLP